MATNKNRIQGYISDTAYQYLVKFKSDNDLDSTSLALEKILEGLATGTDEILQPVAGKLKSELSNEVCDRVLSEIESFVDRKTDRLEKEIASLEKKLDDLLSKLPSESDNSSLKSELPSNLNNSELLDESNSKILKKTPMWRVGSRCDVQQPSGTVIPNMKIVSVDRKNRTCKVVDENTGTHFLASFEQLSKPFQKQSRSLKQEKPVATD